MNDLASVHGSPIAPARPAANPANPLLLVPADWREPLSLLWACNAHLLPSALPLCARMRLYCDRGLDAADVQRITTALLDPDRQANHRFAADLLADLAALVGQAMKRKTAATEVAARRKEAAAFERGCVLTADLFQIPE